MEEKKSVICYLKKNHDTQSIAQFFFYKREVSDWLEERSGMGVLDWVFISHKILYFTNLNLVKLTLLIYIVGINIIGVKKFYISHYWIILQQWLQTTVCWHQSSLRYKHTFTFINYLSEETIKVISISTTYQGHSSCSNG